MKKKDTIKGKYCTDTNELRVNFWDGFGSNFSKFEFVVQKIISTHKVDNVIEVGSYLGYSTIRFARMIEGKVYAVDPWELLQNKDNELQSTCLRKYIKNVKIKKWLPLYEQFLLNCKLKKVKNIVPIKCKSEEAAKSLKIDTAMCYLLFLDGDHSYQGVTSDLTCWNKKLKGLKYIICGDDWEHIRHINRKKEKNYSVDHKKSKIVEIDVNNIVTESELSLAVIDFAKKNGNKIFTFGKLWWLDKKIIL